MKNYNLLLSFSFSFLIFQFSSAQPLNQKTKFTHQDTLRGTIGPGRIWWNVLRYDIQVTPHYQSKKIEGVNTIEFETKKYPAVPLMQIDLQEPMMIDSMFYGHRKLTYRRDGNAFFTTLPKGKGGPKKAVIKIYYSGKPRIAQRPPWDGGWIFTFDEKGRPWMTVACQGLGASAWYPCKDHQSDEPDHGATLSITVVDSLVAIGNGRLKKKQSNNDGTTTWTWEVKSPINNYTIIPYIGKYVTWHEDYNGEKGNLDLDFWVLDYNLEKAKKQFTQVKDMLKCFEYWMGPYPFYEDGFKLVETSHLGMEHQSAVAYGNHFMNGYLGRDLSGSGWGNNWDYIIVHESGHEWFGNNITSNDIADMWVHEGFTDYTETLFVECQYGKEAANAYARGLRRTIGNRQTIIGPYGVNQEGSGDMYNKGNNLLHTIRQVIDNDSLFRDILRGLNKVFYHKTVNTKDVENYISKRAGKDLSKIFDQYLRTTKIPVLEYKEDGNEVSYRWANVVDGFNMPVFLSSGKKFFLRPTTEWQQATLPLNFSMMDVDKNFYITVKKVE